MIGSGARPSDRMVGFVLLVASARYVRPEPGALAPAPEVAPDLGRTFRSALLD
jgi:hypothetical protein